MKTFETQTIVNLGHICWTLLDLGQLWVTWLKSHCSSSLGFAGYFNIFHGSSWALIESSMPIFSRSEYWFPKNRLYKAHPLTRHEPSEGFQIFSIVGDTNWSLYKYLILADISPLSHGPTAWRKVCCSSKTLLAVTLQRPSSDYAVAMWEVRFGCRWLEDVNELNMQQLYFIDNSMLVLRTGGITLDSR